MVSHQAETFTAPPLWTTMFAAGIMTAKPIAARSNPRPNLVGDESWRPRFAMATHSAANIGAQTMMNAELIDWNQSAGTSNPKKRQSVKSRPKRLSHVGAGPNA